MGGREKRREGKKGRKQREERKGGTAVDTDEEGNAWLFEQREHSHGGRKGGRAAGSQIGVRRLERRGEVQVGQIAHCVE